MDEIAETLEEGDKCPVCEKGTMGYEDVENCSCHISAPCSACVNNPLICNNCGCNEDGE